MRLETWIRTCSPCYNALWSHMSYGQSVDNHHRGDESTLIDKCSFVFLVAIAYYLTYCSMVWKLTGLIVNCNGTLLWKNISRLFFFSTKCFSLQVSHSVTPMTNGNVLLRIWLFVVCCVLCLFVFFLNFLKIGLYIFLYIFK